MHIYGASKTTRCTGIDGLNRCRHRQWNRTLMGLLTHLPSHTPRGSVQTAKSLRVVWSLCGGGFRGSFPPQPTSSASTRSSPSPSAQPSHACWINTTIASHTAAGPAWEMTCGLAFSPATIRRRKENGTLVASMPAPYDVSVLKSVDCDDCQSQHFEF